MDYDDPLSDLKGLLAQADNHVAAKDWTYLGHVLTNLAAEAMNLAEKAQHDGSSFDPDHDPEGGV